MTVTAAITHAWSPDVRSTELGKLSASAATASATGAGRDWESAIAGLRLSGCQSGLD